MTFDAIEFRDVARVALAGDSLDFSPAHPGNIVEHVLWSGVGLSPFRHIAVWPAPDRGVSWLGFTRAEGGGCWTVPIRQSDVPGLLGQRGISLSDTQFVWRTARPAAANPFESKQPPGSQNRVGRVYVLLAKEVGMVKIGFSADVRQRLSSLRTASPVELELIANVPGDIQLERTLHHRFATHRQRGEWFRAAPEVMRLVTQMAGNG